MNRHIFSLIICAMVATGCHRKTTEKPPQPVALHPNCNIKPEPGPCRMAVKRYYYDPADKKCKEFIYGGCKGAVPFESLKECQKACGCVSDSGNE